MGESVPLHVGTLWQRRKGKCNKLKFHGFFQIKKR